jgi:hypothetical protein
MPNPNKIARVDLNSVLFWTAQVYDRAFVSFVGIQ